jgi:hypothetical protein
MVDLDADEVVVALEEVEVMAEAAATAEAEARDSLANAKAIPNSSTALTPQTPLTLSQVKSPHELATSSGSFSSCGKQSGASAQLQQSMQSAKMEDQGTREETPNKKQKEAQNGTALGRKWLPWWLRLWVQFMRTCRLPWSPRDGDWGGAKDGWRAPVRIATRMKTVNRRVVSEALTHAAANPTRSLPCSWPPNPGQVCWDLG